MRYLLLISLLLTGCATFTNTPAQEQTIARLQACGIQPTSAYIKPDGAWFIPGNMHTKTEQLEILECMGKTGRTGWKSTR